MNTKSSRNEDRTPQMVTTSFRIEAELLDRFRSAAREDERTMNAQLRYLVTHYLERRQAGDRRAA